MGNSSKRDIERAEVFEKRKRCLELRMAGLSLEEVARREGYSGRQGAAKAIDTALMDIIREPARAVLALELNRLDAATQAIWKKVRSGDIQSIQTLIRVMERRAKYLGLDAPTKSAVTIDDLPNDPKELAALAVEYAAKVAGGSVPGSCDDEANETGDDE